MTEEWKKNIYIIKKQSKHKKQSGISKATSKRTQGFQFYIGGENKKHITVN